MNSTIFNCILRSDLGRLVQLLVDVRRETVLAGSATFGDANTSGETFLRHSLHNFDLPCSKELN